MRRNRSNMRRTSPERLLRYRHNARIERILYEISCETGARTETTVARVLKQLEEKKMLPIWITGWTAHQVGSPEDKRGIDVTVRTDAGEAYLQIKSSLAGREKFEARQKGGRYAKDIVVVVINWRFTDEIVGDVLIEAVRGVRNILLKRAAAARAGVGARSQVAQRA